jgi:hypothetical protein
MCRTIGLQLVVALFLGGVGNFKRWDLAGGSRSLGGGSLWLSCPCTGYSLYSHEVRNLQCHSSWYHVLLRHMKSNNHGLNPLKT